MDIFFILLQVIFYMFHHYGITDWSWFAVWWPSFVVGLIIVCKFIVNE